MNPQTLGAQPRPESRSSGLSDGVISGNLAFVICMVVAFAFGIGGLFF